MNLMNQINYLKNIEDIDMFDGCSVPSPLDMSRVRGAIIMRCGLLTPLYSEPQTQHYATQQFFFENQWNFDHIVKIINASYSPIENVAEEREETLQNSGNDTLTIAKNSTTTNIGSETSTMEISAENSSAYQPDNQRSDSNMQTTTTGGSDTHTTQKGSSTKQNMSRHGNIGVTTNQDMIEQELDLLERFNPYRFIADLYEKELIIGLY